MKMFIRMFTLMFILVTAGTAFAAAQTDVKVSTTKPGAKLTVDKALSAGRLLVSVDDAKKQPVLGLGIQDFSLACKEGNGRVLSVQSVSEVVDVPLSIVIVLDNSYSMYDRNAIKPLLEGLDRVLTLVRPIDKVELVVFDEKLTTKVGNRNLRVQTFTSSNPDELRAFAKKYYSLKQLTAGTYLYEAALVAVNDIAAMPADTPRIAVVFTDGEDLNSVVKKDEVAKAANKAGNFTAYVIDYMEGPKVNKDLAKFAADHRGKAWKSKSEVDLLSIWENVAKGLDFSYVLSYECTKPPVILVAKDVAKPKYEAPVLAVFEESLFFDFDKSELKPTGKDKLKAYREQAKGLLSSASKIKITGHTDSIGTAEYNMGLSQRRAEAVAEYLKSLGVDPAKMEVKGEGKSRPMFDNRTKEGRAKNRRVEVEVSGFIK
jgi:outer membrane protein OmpA-like peptidoglycan-associated protein